MRAGRENVSLHIRAPCGGAIEIEMLFAKWYNNAKGRSSWMSLNIYRSRQAAEAAGLMVIQVNDTLFDGRTPLAHNPLVSEIRNEVDHAEYVSKTSFRDRVGEVCEKSIELGFLEETKHPIVDVFVKYVVKTLNPERKAQFKRAVLQM